MGTPLRDRSRGEVSYEMSRTVLLPAATTWEGASKSSRSSSMSV